MRERFAQEEQPVTKMGATMGSTLLSASFRKTRCLIFYFILIRMFNYGAFHTSYSRWQIPTVYDFKDRHDIRLLQTEAAAFEVCRQFLDVRGLRAGAQDRTHSSDRHAR